jgi:hypothetical protein
MSTNDFIRDLNRQGVYLRNGDDVLRMHYGLNKTISKLAKGIAEIPPEERVKIERARVEGKRNITAKFDMERKQAEAYFKKTLTRFEADGIKISYQGALCDAKIFVNLNGDRFDLEITQMTYEDFKEFARAAKKERRKSERLLSKVVETVDKFTKGSKILSSGKSTDAFKPKGTAQKVLTYLAGFLGVSLVVAAISFFGWAWVMSYFAVLSEGTITLGWTVALFTSIKIVLGTWFSSWMVLAVKKYGFKGAFKMLSLKMNTKLAHQLPSMEYQRGVLAGYSNPVLG